MSARAQTPANVAAATLKPATQAEQSFAMTHDPLKATVGQASKLAFEVTAGKGYKINPEYPWQVRIEGSKPLGIVAAQMNKDTLDMDAKRVKVHVPVTPVGAGKHFVKGSVNISVCETTGAKKCLWFNEEPITLEVDAAKL